jgi:hypothetical protein
MKTLVVNVNHPGLEGLLFKHVLYSSGVRRSLNSSNFITPKERIRNNFAGKLLLTWSFSVDLQCEYHD